MNAARLALFVLLYPVAFGFSLWFPQRPFNLSSEDEGTFQLVLLCVLMLTLGIVARTWWALFVPLVWAAVAFAIGFAFPFENTDPIEGRIWFATVVAAGIVPLAVGVAGTRAARRLRRSGPA
jgi:hypothetical protein